MTLILSFFISIGIDIRHAHRDHATPQVSLIEDSQAKTNRAVVAIATSEDKEIQNPVPLTAERVTYEQVDAVVRRALELDKSETCLSKIIKPTDHVLIKLNLVSAPMYDRDGKRKNEHFFDNGEGHWGDETDARVVKSVVNYLVEKIKPQRISLVEGATWIIGGKRGQGPQYEGSYDEDGWTLHWREFDNISYKDMCEEFTRSQNHTVVDYIDLNEDKYRFVPVPGGALQRVDVKFRSGKFGYGVTVPGTGTPRDGYYMPETIINGKKLINIPAMKMNIGGGTLLFKNYVGAFASIPYGDGRGKSQMDRFGFAPGMLDIFSYCPTDYGVIAGFWASERDWPSKTQNLHHNIVVAGGNPVATEATTLRAMGVNPSDVVAMHLARNKGIGSFEEKDITVVGKQVREVRRNFLKHSGYQGIGFQNYLMNGPYKETDLDKDILGGETLIKPKDGQKASTGKPWWVFKHPYGFPEAYVSLNETLTEDLANTITYAYLCLKSPMKQMGKFMFGYDGGAKVFLNGKEIFRDEGPHEYQLREKAVPVVLEKGENHLLIKLKTRYGAAGFASSIEDTAKTMLYDLEVVVPKEKGTIPPIKNTKL
ncbi:MAG: DUF362 domain-containing protein [Candidatus Latescibacterota bacterium]